MDKKITLALCDDIRQYCLYLKRAFAGNENIEVIGTSNSAEECLEMFEKIKPDVLLLDVQMETADSGIEIIPELLKLSPKTKIIILTVHYDEVLIYRALSAGASNYLIKTASDEEILKAITDIRRNTYSLNNNIVQAVLNESSRIKQQNSSLLYVINTVSKLSASEFNILYDLHLGLSYSEIAKKRFVELTTVRSQVSRILKKFGYPNIDELVKSLINMDFFNNIKKSKIDI